ncbi:CD1375 family protein [Levilactobacillus acidifarinae]|uniref:Uncharacterized protein n=1 Tax=Levilactobacillus acidifarinae DSM 19394 = JCM 15949 TaxID=1423715 RepID=A0A0R1LW55_9LACO|nr:CD1375 family protein [Levilactobacillus acidifarinae]KRK96514.1 hypothetical protein FD25_GL002011 [Levilactobacillus acidifarinae DSM 19394]GEO70421.1 hypothetical protein LAC03_23310 [Levilactobacillus acidifarinae]
MAYSALAQIYANAIAEKSRTLDGVPTALRAEVQACIDDKNQNSDKNQGDNQSC